MTQTMPSCDSRRYTDDAISEMQQIADEDEILNAAVSVILENPEARLHELFHKLWMLGLDVFDVVPCALSEVT